MTRDNIITAAFKVWGRDLYRTTSLTELSQELGVSKPALYRHFKDKEALLEAMQCTFFDTFSAFIKSEYDRAVTVSDKRESCLIIMRAMTEYYIRNKDAFVFSLTRVYGNRNRESLGEEFRSRGIDMRNLYQKDENASYPTYFQLVMVTVVFFTANFHRSSPNQDGIPSDELVTQTLNEIEHRILHGMELEAERVASLNYEELEKCAAGINYVDAKENAPDDALLKAVAEAVAEAGPWNASMEMVARRSGLSKSGLYAHFKSRQDMLDKFFITELTNIVTSARVQIETSEGEEEQLYLAILAVVNYLRSRPEILAAIDWIKTRRLKLGKPVSDQFSGIIKTIKIKAVQEYDSLSLVWIAHWVLFMVVNTLAWWPSKSWKDPACKSIDWTKNIMNIPSESFRILFRFIALGWEGLII